MKELTTEQKAQRYDEALNRAKKELQVCDSINCWSAKQIFRLFPELTESEDEDLKEQVVYAINQLHVCECTKNKLINWINKKDRQKPINKIQFNKKYKCIASPRYSTFKSGEIYKPENKFLYDLMNFYYDCFEPIEEDDQKHTDIVEPKFREGD